MREALAKLEGKRCAWTATFVRYGSRPGFQGAPPVPTVLVRDLKDVLGHVVADHMWFTETVEMKACALEVGVDVAFSARVERYEKGYRGPRDLPEAPPPSYDFRLARPTDFRVKTAAPPSREWRTDPTGDATVPMEQLGLFG